MIEERGDSLRFLGQHEVFAEVVIELQNLVAAFIEEVHPDDEVFSDAPRSGDRPVE